MATMKLTTLRNAVFELISDTAYDNGYPDLRWLSIEELVEAIEDLGPLAVRGGADSDSLAFYSRVLKQAHAGGATDWSDTIRF